MPALRGSLAALHLDYVDMYLVHWPIALKVRDAQSVFFSAVIKANMELYLRSA